MAPRANRHWNIRSIGPRHAIVVQGGQRLEFSALASDLFRIRSLAEDSSAREVSWAVVRTEWQPCAVEVRRTRGTLQIETPQGVLQMALATGVWGLSDRSGIPIFESHAPGVAMAESQSTLDLRLVEREAIFGMGEVSGPWNFRGRIREFWNVDVLGVAPAIYPGIPSLYLSIPFAISLRDGRAGGLFWDNPGRQTWDVGSSDELHWRMTAATGGVDLYLFAGPTVPEVVERYTSLTGRIPLPPRWGLGYHQSRYSYQSRREVERMASEFRRRQLPCDALYLDIHHLDGYRVFTFGKDFSNPQRWIERLANQGFQVVPIVDPGVKVDSEFGVFQRGCEQDAFVKAPGGAKDFEGEVWPGTSRYPDFFSSSTREWWGQEQAALLRLGVAGVWNDMNEPANFARPDKTLDPGCVHRTAAGTRPHQEIHNAYGSEMARASREGILAHGGGQRPFVITRAGYAGVQRHALVWTGDTSSSWDHLRDVIPQLMNLSLSGVAYCGADVGGFLGHCPPELFVRWFQLAALTPFFRNHTNTGTRRQEPWAYGTSIEDICRNYLQFRQKILPHLYCLMAGAHFTGTPMMRPLLWHYSNDVRSVACGSQFLVGRDLLVAPILEAGATARSVYLPPDRWYDFWTGEEFPGGRNVLVESSLSHLPLFVRAGAIIALGANGLWSGAEDRTEVSLRCWPGGAGELEWYEDDEVSEAYHQGTFLRRSMRLRGRGSRWSLEFSATEGSFPSRVLRWRIVAPRGRGKRAVLARLNGKLLESVTETDNGFFNVDIPNQSGPMNMEWTS